MRFAALVLATTLSMVTVLAQTSKKAAVTPHTVMTGVCTYYATTHDGHITASGEKFDSNVLTAAHRKLPLGTKLKVTNLANNKSVVVRVNDRGPFAKGRHLSVTKRAAEELGFIKEGRANVRMQPVQ